MHGLLKLEQVSKVYKGGKKAVNSIDLEIAKGEFICFIGPSGHGKNDNDEDDQQTDRTIVWKDFYRRRKYYGTGPG